MSLDGRMCICGEAEVPLWTGASGMLGLVRDVVNGMLVG